MLKYVNSNQFLFFSYGDNMFSLRIHMHCPTAEFVSIARLDNYRLEFFRFSKFWQGPTATLVPTANAHVWGVIWKLQDQDRIALDEAKGVEVNKYYIKYLDVLTPYNGVYHCRTYTQKINPFPRGDNDPVPVERWPSWTLKRVMLLGATHHGLPEYYIRQLKKLKDNGAEGCLRMYCLLNRYAKEPPCKCRVPGRIPRIPLKLDMKKLKEKQDIKT